MKQSNTALHRSLQTVKAKQPPQTKVRCNCLHTATAEAPVTQPEPSTATQFGLKQNGSDRNPDHLFPSALQPRETNLTFLKSLDIRQEEHGTL